MKRLFIGLLALCFFGGAVAQKTSFIYLQTEQETAFFVKWGEKVYNSNPAGYLILPGITDASYEFSLGFPDSRITPQRFSIDVRGKDRGFLVKYFNEKGWGLYDLQTSGLVMALPEKQVGVQMEPRENVTPFTRLLAKAANDPTLTMRPVVAKQEEKQPEVKATEVAVKQPEKPALQNDTVQKNNIAKSASDQKDVVPPGPGKAKTGKVDSVAVQATPERDTLVAKKEDKPAPVMDEKVPVKAVAMDSVQRLAAGSRDTMETVNREKNTGISKAVVDTKTERELEKKQDSLVVTDVAAGDGKEEKTAKPVAYRRSEVRKRSESSTSQGLGLTFIDEYPDGSRDTIRIMIPNPSWSGQAAAPQSANRRFLDISGQADTATVRSKAAVLDSVSKAAEWNAANPACKSEAGESDFLKLQKKLMTEKDEDDQLAEARKAFRSKCYSTSYIRTLGRAFATDAGRYKFFDVAYPYVSDSQNFATLASELREEYYLNRFRAMLR